MQLKTFKLKSNENASLKTYILDYSEEMPNMAKRPAMLIIPGGSYLFVSDREMEPIAMFFNSMGYNSFVLTYTLGEKNNFQMALDDANAAIELIHEKAEEFMIDKNKVGVIGFSAGGHLAASLSTMGDIRPDACVLCYPCIREDISEILAFPVPGVENYVDKKTPPTFIATSALDPVVPAKNSLSYANALDRAGVPYELHVFARGNHGFSLCDSSVCSTNEILKQNERAAQWKNLCINWLHDVLDI